MESTGRYSTVTLWQFSYRSLVILLQGRPVNAEFRLEIDILHYENPAHELESGDCCNCSFLCFLGCTNSCDNFFVIGVHNGTCLDAGCELWGRFEYHYGDDDSSTSRAPVIILGQQECPLQVCYIVSNATKYECPSHYDSLWKLLLLFIMEGHT